MKTKRRQRAIVTQTADSSQLHAPIDLSFPCVGYLDEGVFDLGLEEDGDDNDDDDGDEDDDDVGDRICSGQDCVPSLALSPDALDLALMDLSKSNDANDDNRYSPIVRNAKKALQYAFSDDGTCNHPGSPFCDATLPTTTQNKNSPCRSRVHGGLLSTESTTMGSTAANQRRRPGWLHKLVSDKKSSPTDNSIRRSSPRLAEDGASPPPASFIRAQSPSISPTCTGRRHRPQEVREKGELRRSSPQAFINRQKLLNRSLVDTNAVSRWAKETKEAREAVELSMRQEEQALAQLKLKEADCTSRQNRLNEWRQPGRRVSFVAKLKNRRSSSLDDDGEWEDMPGVEHNEEKDDLAARASDLHSSVAGQLRSVNELLKRKSYFYIDTSWRASQLPCPPTSWKGRNLSNNNSGADVETESEANSGSTAVSMSWRRSHVGSNVNIDVKLEGKWVSSAKRRRVGIYSIPGVKAQEPAWRCQDACLAMAPFDRRENQALFAVLDGHGENGRQAARECAERLPKYLLPAFYSEDTTGAFRRACQKLQNDLATSGSNGDVYSRSGTTLCAALLTGTRLTIANVGDSGCLRISRQPLPGEDLAQRTVPSSDVGLGVVRRRFGSGGLDMGSEMSGSKTGRLVAERLSRDHKPERKDELDRIRAAGGVVFPLPLRSAVGGGGTKRGVQAGSPGLRCGQASAWQNEGIVRDFDAEVPRVWRADGNGPGLAMSRSIGDKMAHSLGVTHEPEITEVDLNASTDLMLIIASDGVWDVLTPEDVRKAAERRLVDDCWSPRALSEEICRAALSAWALATSGGSDDITCMVVKTSDLGGVTGQHGDENIEKAEK